MAPGLVDTELTRGWDPNRRRLMIERTPLGRLTLPEEVADAILAAVTHLTFSTGIVVSVDGGRPLGQ